MGDRRAGGLGALSVAAQGHSDLDGVDGRDRLVHRRRDGRGGRRLVGGVAEHPAGRPSGPVPFHRRRPGRCHRGRRDLQATAGHRGLDRGGLCRLLRRRCGGRAHRLPDGRPAGPDLWNTHHPALGGRPGRRYRPPSRAALRERRDVAVSCGLRLGVGGAHALGHAARILRPVHRLRRPALLLGVPQALSKLGRTVQSVPRA